MKAMLMYALLAQVGVWTMDEGGVEGIVGNATQFESEPELAMSVGVIAYPIEDIGDVGNATGLSDGVNGDQVGDVAGII